MRINIAALGSSFAAGPSIQPIVNEAAGRSGRNYAHLLAAKLHANLTDLTVSGATLLNVLSEKQEAGIQTFDPQLDYLPSNTDIVTLTCGGNDIGYIGSLMNQSLISHVGTDPWLMASGAKATPPLDAPELKRRLVAIIDKTRLIAPNSRLFLVQYLSVIGNDTKPRYDVALSPEHVRHFDNVARMLAQAYVDSGQERPSCVEVVPVAEVSRDHGLGSAIPWVRGFAPEMLLHGPAPFHPNAAGHAAVAEMVYRQIMDKSAPPTV